MNRQTESILGDQSNFILGVTGLADFLRVSMPTAKRLKRKLPHYEFGPHTIRFKKIDVIEDVEKNQKTNNK